MSFSREELDALEVLQRQHTSCPQFWDSTYRISQDYIPWRKLRDFYTTMRAQEWMEPWTLGGEGRSDTFFKSMAHAGRMADAVGFPFYVVSKSLLEVLDLMDLDEELDIENDCPLPFESFTLLFPKGYLELSDHLGNEFHILGMQVTRMRNMRPTDGGPRRDLITTHLINGDQACGMATFSIFNGKLQADRILSRPEYEKNRDAAHKQIKMIMKILAAMAAEPELVDAVQKEGFRPAKKGKRELTFLLPRFLGLKYRLDHGPEWQAESIHEKQHRRPHFRRGHIRRQQIGPRSGPREYWKYKVVMIKPMPVGLKVKKEHENEP